MTWFTRQNFAEQNLGEFKKDSPHTKDFGVGGGQKNSLAQKIQAGRKINKRIFESLKQKNP